MRRSRHVLLLLTFLLPAAPLAAQETVPAREDAQAPVPTSDDPDAADASASKVPLAEIRRYVAVYKAIKDAYVDPVDDRTLMQAAIRGLLLDLDPHSAYLDKAAAEAFDEQTTGAYDGIGVELLQEDNVLKVVAPIDGTPAARAGLQPGDSIIAIDGRPIAQVEGMEPLRGAPGTSVTITVMRPGRDQPFDVTLVRETIRVTSVRSRMLEPGYGYVRISTFQADTGTDFRKHLEELQARAGGRLRGLVLDLRSNPGGLLTAAVQVADELLDRLGLSAKAGAYPGRLSGGERQRVALARALVNEPPLLLADEPTGAVDANAGAQVADLFRDLNRGGQTILLVTHDPALARRCATRVVELRDGRLTAAEVPGPTTATPDHTTAAPGVPA